MKQEVAEQFSGFPDLNGVNVRVLILDRECPEETNVEGAHSSAPNRSLPNLAVQREFD